MKKIAANKNYEIMKKATGGHAIQLEDDGSIDPKNVQQHITSLWEKVNWVERNLLTVLPEEVTDTLP